MAVSQNANASAIAESDTATSTIDNTNLTVAAGADAIIAWCGWSDHTIAGVTAVWDPAGAAQSLTLIGVANNAATNGRVALYGAVGAIATGNKIMRLSWSVSSATNVVLHAASYAGVNQAGGTASFARFGSATGNSNAQSITIASAVGNLVIDNGANDTSTMSGPTGPSVSNYLTNVPSLLSAGGSHQAGAASVTMAWTLALTSQWVSVACDLVAAISLTAAQEAGIFDQQLSGQLVGLVEL